MKTTAIRISDQSDTNIRAAKEDDLGRVISDGLMQRKDSTIY